VELRQVKSVELTELNYMTALFEFGRAQGRLGAGWQHAPPNLYH
jgi:hypothetical protein